MVAGKSNKMQGYINYRMRIILQVCPHWNSDCTMWSNRFFKFHSTIFRTRGPLLVSSKRLTNSWTSSWPTVRSSGKIWSLKTGMFVQYRWPTLNVTWSVWRIQILFTLPDPNPIRIIILDSDRFEENHKHKKFLSLCSIRVSNFFWRNIDKFASGFQK